MFKLSYLKANNLKEYIFSICYKFRILEKEMNADYYDGEIARKEMMMNNLNDYLNSLKILVS